MPSVDEAVSLTLERIHGRVSLTRATSEVEGLSGESP